MNVTIDKEFRTLITPHTEEEFAGLEALCLKYGIQDSLKTWNGILIDGHNRYEIAEKHGLEFKTEEMEFSNRDDVKLWIIKNQLGRRNLSKIDEIRLREREHEILAREAEKKVGGRPSKADKKSCPVTRQGKRENSTDYKIAKEIGMSEDTYRKGKAILESGDQEIIDKVRKRELSINKAYREVKGLPPKKNPQPQTEVREVEIAVTNEDVMKNPIQAKEVEIEADIINKPVEEEPLPFEEITEDVSEELAHTFDVFDAAPVAELGRVFETLLDLKENEDSLIDGIKKSKTGSEKEEFRKQLTDCGKFLAHIETMLIGW